MIQLKNTRGGGVAAGRVLRFTVADADNKGHLHFSARDRLVRALADSALAQLGLTLPVEEMREQQCRELFSTWNAMPTDYIDSVAVRRVSAETVKPRTLDVVCVCVCGVLYVVCPSNLR